MYGTRKQRIGARRGGEWLFCLKETAPGERQAVWSGIEGDGVFAVVDFNGDVRPRHRGRRIWRGKYEGWGRITQLPRPITVETLQRHRVLARLFARSIQGVWDLEPEEGRAIAQLAGGLPPAATFTKAETNWREKGGDWGQYSLPPEAIQERLVHDMASVARKLGFTSRVHRQKHLSNGRIPDLWCDAGVVGEVKNQVTAARGPDQIEDYIEQCERQWPEHSWRGVLVQGQPEMAPNAYPRLKESKYRRRIEVWAVQEEGRGRVTVDRLFPKARS
jgi:hypothetical protein